MRRLVLAFALSALALGLFAAPAAAKCPACVDGVSVQTPGRTKSSARRPARIRRYMLYLGRMNSSL